MNAFIAIPSSWLIAMSTVFADHRHEACFLDTCLLCVTGPSHMHTCQRTPGPTCVVCSTETLAMVEMVHYTPRPMRSKPGCQI